MSVTVSGLSKFYGNQKAVNEISFGANSGEVLGFLGPNGAGKSTTMKMLTGFIPADTGTATVCGFDIQKQSREVKKNIGYLPENNPLYTDMYVKEYLQFMASVHQIENKKSRIAEMIERTGLAQEQKKKIGALSKGYRQRVGLAQAMLHNPQVLIMDEPTTGLDPNQLVEIRELIRELGKSKTVILSTHIMQEVQAICNRVVIINQGEIVADSTPELLQQKRSGEIVLIVEFKNQMNKTDLEKIKGVLKTEKISNNRFKIFSDRDIQEQVFKMAVEQNNIITTMQTEQLNLEEVFKQLTK